MKSLKAILLIVLSTIAVALFGQTKDSLRANNYPSIMPYVPKTPDYKNDHMNIHDTAFNNTRKRNERADSAAIPKKTEIENR